VRPGICAFCYTELDLDQPGSLSIDIGSDRNECRQELVAHAACLAERLAPQIPFDASVFEQADSD
jgi:hypothetical protein